SATLAVSYRADWLLYAAMALFLVGLAAYAVILWRFDFRSFGTGAGDQWVVGGALAIGTLAAGKIAVADAAGAWTGLLDDLALALWCVAMAWLIPLVISEVIRPRLRYHVLRWATVFPVGMYAACSFAVAVTLIVLIGLTRRVLNDRDVADRDVADRDVADRDVADRVMPDRVRDG